MLNWFKKNLLHGIIFSFVVNYPWIAFMLIMKPFEPVIIKLLYFVAPLVFLAAYMLYAVGRDLFKWKPRFFSMLANAIILAFLVVVMYLVGEIKKLTTTIIIMGCAIAGWWLFKEMKNVWSSMSRSFISWSGLVVLAGSLLAFAIHGYSIETVSMASVIITPIIVSACLMLGLVNTLAYAFSGRGGC